MCFYSTPNPFYRSFQRRSTNYVSHIWNGRFAGVGLMYSLLWQAVIITHSDNYHHRRITGKMKYACQR